MTRARLRKELKELLAEWEGQRIAEQLTKAFPPVSNHASSYLGAEWKSPFISIALRSFSPQSKSLLQFGYPQKAEQAIYEINNCDKAAESSYHADMGITFLHVQITDALRNIAYNKDYLEKLSNYIFSPSREKLLPAPDFKSIKSAPEEKKESSKATVKEKNSERIDKILREVIGTYLEKFEEIQKKPFLKRPFSSFGKIGERRALNALVFLESLQREKKEFRKTPGIKNTLKTKRLLLVAALLSRGNALKSELIRQLEKRHISLESINKALSKLMADNPEKYIKLLAQQLESFDEPNTKDLKITLKKEKKLSQSQEPPTEEKEEEKDATPLDSTPSVTLPSEDGNTERLRRRSL